VGKGPDWAKTGTIVAMAEWLRDKSGALAVVVVRRDDATLAADLHLAAKDARDLLTDRMPALARDLQASRTEKRRGARLELGPIQE
jgi:hypothetical protein